MISKIKKNELMAILKTNRDRHKSIFDEAFTRYRALVIENMEKNLDDAKHGREIRTMISLVLPVDQTSDYDRAIRMLELHDNETIELDAHEFDNYVMDNWEWSGRFTASNSLYTDRLKSHR